MPKRCFATIPKSDGGGSIEKLHAFLDARFPGSNPNIPRLLFIQAMANIIKEPTGFFLS
jgi:hypothetical protein